MSAHLKRRGRLWNLRYATATSVTKQIKDFKKTEPKNETSHDYD